MSMLVVQSAFQWRQDSLKMSRFLPGQGATPASASQARDGGRLREDLVMPRR